MSREKTNLLYSFFFLSSRRIHYEVTLELPTVAPTAQSMSCQYSAQYGTSSPSGPSSPTDGGGGGGGGVGNNSAVLKVGLAGSLGGGGGNGGGGPVGPAGYFASTPPHQMHGLPQPPRQKGRPRKRKPKDIESMTSNLGE